MSQRILLIQDDTANAQAILQGLRHSDDQAFEVEWVRSCSDGLERLVGVAAILVDLVLPDSRGIETFDRLFRAAAHIPILILIDPQDEEIAKLAVQGGAQDYLFKGRLDAYLLPKAVGTDRIAALPHRGGGPRRQRSGDHSVPAPCPKPWVA